MRGKWLAYAILYAASRFVVGDERGDWLEWWRSELWYVPASEARRFSFGAFRDAVWLRRNDSPGAKRSLLASPFVCIALLAVLAAACLASVPHLERILSFPESHGRRALDGLVEFGYLYLLLGGVVIVGESPVNRRAARPNTWRGWVFLSLKALLLLPILECTVLVAIVLELPPLSLGAYAIYMLLFRWVLKDQRRRCPVCLRLLSQPVRIGTPSETFLEWYGAESLCGRGHGLMHAPEISTSYSGGQRWLSFDESWNEAFSTRVELRP